jgi:hypothetical protein
LHLFLHPLLLVQLSEQAQLLRFHDMMLHHRGIYLRLLRRLRLRLRLLLRLLILLHL